MMQAQLFSPAGAIHDDEDDIEEQDTSEWKCVMCGCTDMNPCAGGCAWVEKNLCSACAEKLQEARENSLQGILFRRIREKSERQLREILYKHHTGFILEHDTYGRYDVINAFPTTWYDFNTGKGVWMIQLVLDGPLETVRLDVLLLCHLLKLDEFCKWNAEQWADWLPSEKKQKEGWDWTGRIYHYFVDGRSLCRSYGLPNYETITADTGNTEHHKDDCKQCFKKLLARRKQLGVSKIDGKA
ncbi:MAG: hypothetical protein WC325_12810 [Candidatus Bathyarchaeia archaeon]|jgi:hypothetical protein